MFQNGIYTSFLFLALGFYIVIKIMPTEPQPTDILKKKWSVFFYVKDKTWEVGHYDGQKFHLLIPGLSESVATEVVSKHNEAIRLKRI